jgi:hypothetical protein
MVPDMLGKLREGLQRIQYPPVRTAVFFDELIRLHERALDPPRVKTPVETSEPHKVIDLGPDFVVSGKKSQLDMDELHELEVFWVGQDEATDAGYLAEDSVLLSDEAHALMSDGNAAPLKWNADDLVIGSWVELHLKEKWIRVQLTWASPHRSLFMFVSGRGTAHSMSQRTMERLRSRDLMRVVSDVPVVDKALNDVAQTALRNDREQSLSRF